MDITNLFGSHRSRLTGLAYRLTGSRQDAEDIVQETFLKWHHAEHKRIGSHPAWLTKVTTNLALDYLKSARNQREHYVGPWLPEPYIEKGENPDSQYELDQSISIALMLTLERLSPAERAAFVLHDVFQYSFNDLAGILDKSVPACRKLASRARDNIQHKKQPNSADRRELEQLSSAFFDAIRQGDVDGLQGLFQEQVAFHADGGGKAQAALEVITGKDRVAAFLIDKVYTDLALAASGDITLTSTWFNGAPGYVLSLKQTPVSAFGFDADQGLISKIYAIRNPDKLRYFI
jgi:RNA polymerase sigma-70 factor, ECF subfamily